MGCSLRTRALLGSSVWLAAVAGAGALLADPDVRRPLARTAGALVEEFASHPERERTYRVAGASGVEPGAAVFRAAAQGPEAPLGCVVSSTAEGVRVRFAPEAGPPEALTLVLLPPSRTLGEALQLAVPPEVGARLGQELEQRLARAVNEVLLPGVEQRLPAFLERLDPRRDPATAALAEQLAAAVLTRLEPLLEGLAGEVTSAVDAHFDLLDRLGLLWKLVRGDSDGLQKQVLPVARKAARAWWAAHSAEVLGAVRQGAEDRRDLLSAFVAGPLWSAARDELVLPILTGGRERLTEEGEGLLRRAVEEVALAPGGGFRPRFSNVLRTHLLGRSQALLLASPVAAPAAAGAPAQVLEPAR